MSQVLDEAELYIGSQLYALEDRLLQAGVAELESGDFVSLLELRGQAAARALSHNPQDWAGGLERLVTLLDPPPNGTGRVLAPFARIGAQCPKLQELLDSQSKILLEQAYTAYHKSEIALGERLDQQWPQQAAHAAMQSLQGFLDRKLPSHELNMQYQAQHPQGLQTAPDSSTCASPSGSLPEPAASQCYRARPQARARLVPHRQTVSGPEQHISQSLVNPAVAAPSRSASLYLGRFSDPALPHDPQTAPQRYQREHFVSPDSTPAPQPRAKTASFANAPLQPQPMAQGIAGPTQGIMGQAGSALDAEAEAVMAAVMIAARPLLRRSLPPRAEAIAAASLSQAFPQLSRPAPAPPQRPATHPSHAAGMSAHAHAWESQGGRGVFELSSGDLAIRTDAGSLRRHLGQATVVSQGAGHPGTGELPSMPQCPPLPQQHGQHLTQVPPPSRSLPQHSPWRPQCPTAAATHLTSDDLWGHVEPAGRAAPATGPEQPASHGTVQDQAQAQPPTSPMGSLPFTQAPLASWMSPPTGPHGPAGADPSRDDVPSDQQNASQRVPWTTNPRSGSASRVMPSAATPQSAACSLHRAALAGINLEPAQQAYQGVRAQRTATRSGCSPSQRSLPGTPSPLKALRDSRASDSHARSPAAVPHALSPAKRSADDVAPEGSMSPVTKRPRATASVLIGQTHGEVNASRCPVPAVNTAAQQQAAADDASPTGPQQALPPSLASLPPAWREFLAKGTRTETQAHAATSPGAAPSGRADVAVCMPAGGDDRAAASAPTRPLRTGKVKDVVRAALQPQAPPPDIPSIVPRCFLERNRQAMRIIRQASEALSQHGPVLMAPSSSGASSLAHSLLTPAAGGGSGHSMRPIPHLLPSRQ